MNELLGPDDVEHDMDVLARTARYREDTIGPEWTIWTPHRLHVQLRQGKYATKLGRVGVLALQRFNWAEYSQGDFDAATGTWSTEGYFLQLKRRAG